MSAVASAPTRSRVRVKRVWEHMGTTKFFTALFAWMFPLVLIFGTSISQRIPLQIHPIVFLSLAVITWAWTVRGPIALARTPIDNFFMIWLLLIVASQLWANVVLLRLLTDNDWIETTKQALTSWIVYRAAHCLGTVEPKTAINHILRAILFFAALACIVGLLQSRGPLQQWALKFASSYGWNPEQVLIGAMIESPRPVGMFSGPNFFAFINLIACAIIVGITLGTGRRMKEIHAFAAVIAMGLFFAGTFVAQSRIALAMLAILIAIFLYLITKGGKGRVTIFAVVAMALTGLTLFALKGDLDFSYLTSVFETGLDNDESFLLRRDAIRAISDLAPELAPLGAGENRFSLLLMRTGDQFSKGNGPDNAFLQAFLDHGIPGILHVMYLIFGLWWGLKLLKTNGEPYLDRMKYVGWLTLFFFVLYSISASRHQKVETGAFLWMIFGPLWAVVKIQESAAKADTTKPVVVKRRRLRLKQAKTT